MEIVVEQTTNSMAPELEMEVVTSSDRVEIRDATAPKSSGLNVNFTQCWRFVSYTMMRREEVFVAEFL